MLTVDNLVNILDSDDEYGVNHLHNNGNIRLVDVAKVCIGKRYQYVVLDYGSHRFTLRTGDKKFRNLFATFEGALEGRRNRQYLKQ